MNNTQQEEIPFAMSGVPFNIKIRCACTALALIAYSAVDLSFSLFCADISDNNKQRFAKLLLFLLGIKVRSSVIDNPKHGWIADVPGSIIISNHNSCLDWLIIRSIVVGPLAFAFKSEIASFPVIGKVFSRAASHFAIDRERGNNYAQMEKRLKELPMNTSLAIFPEGRVNAKEGELTPFRSGFASLAYVTGRQIFCIGISGMSDIVPDPLFHPVKKGTVEAVLDDTLLDFDEPPEGNFDVKTIIINSEIIPTCEERVANLVEIASQRRKARV